MKAVIIVFEDTKFIEDATDDRICISDIKAVCDWEDRWEVFCSFLKPDNSSLGLYREDNGIVRWEYDDGYSAYGVIKKIL